jgi:allophanate hydrolase
MIAGPFTVAGLKAAYRSGAASPVDVARETLRRIAAYDDPAVWISRVPEDDVLAHAEALAAHGDPECLPLFGIPFAVKDNIDYAGMPTTAGCPDFAYMPEHSASCVDRLIAAGAILVGKTNLDQFATGLVGTRSPYGAPRCVFDSRYVSGGSSSGSAVAVAAGLVAFALGTDTAGSGRVPAAFNNIVGLKPSKGLISARGVVPACRTLDCVSIFAHGAGDAAEVLRIAEGFDSADPFSRSPSVRRLPQEKFRFGVLPPGEWEFFADAEQAQLYGAAVARLGSCGGEPVEIDFQPFRDAGALLYEGAWTAERLASVKSFLARHEDRVDPVVRKIIVGASRLSAVDAFESVYRLAAFSRAAEAQWKKADLLLLLTAPGQPSFADVAADPIGANARLGRYTNFVNLLDLCAIAVPAGFRSGGLAFGVTLMAPAFADADLAAIAERFEQTTVATTGAARELSPEGSSPAASRGSMIDLFVVGAHLSGMPLNHELRERGAVFVRSASTAPEYRFYALADAAPAKPGLVRHPGAHAASIAGEIWQLPAHEFGCFVAQIPSPLGVGKIVLDDGSIISGFLCEAHAVRGAEDITRFGSWRRYHEEARPLDAATQRRK